MVILELKVLNKSDNEIGFSVEGIPVSLASAIRKAMISEVPTMAIEKVTFKKNDSALNDEVIANRLGQIPFTFNKKAYNLPEKCICKGKGCSRCQIEMVLKKKGIGVVYSGDIKTTSKDVKPVFDKMPITEMFEPKDRIEFTAITTLGIGKKHAKWQGAVVGYRNLAKITVSKDLHGKKEHVDSCPVNVFDLKGDKISVSRPLNCILCMNCVDVSKGKISVDPINDSFVFNVETVSGLDIKDLVKSSLEVLDGKLDTFEKALKKVA